MALLLELQARRKDSLRIAATEVKRRKNPNALMPVPKDAPMKERRRI